MPHRTRQGWGQLRVLATALLATIAVLATSAIGSAQAQQTSGSPTLLTAPTLKGSTAAGKTLRVTHGTWSGTKPIGYSYGWQLCNAAGGECSTIPSAEGASIRTGSGDVGRTLRAVVKATNSVGSASATTAPSAQIGPVAPKRKKSPTVTGTAEDGQVLSAVEGTWKGTPPYTLSYQWQSCHGGDCADIAGATNSSYRADTAEIGEKLRVVITAKNAAGAGSSASKKTAVIQPGPPVDVAPPSVSGLPVLEQTLTAEVGTWAGTGPFEYSYQWRGCNLLGECENIAGATEPTYTVGPLQIANSIEVVVTARSSFGSASATSEPTNLVKALLPANTELPSVTGLLQDGGALSALTGAWASAEPLEYSYAWELCNSAGSSCKEVSGAIGSSLGLLTSEIGDTVRVVVTATNSAGSTSATSEPTSVIKALLPSNTELPSVSGLLQDGGVLSALTGAWSGSGPLEYSYAWELCNSAGASCKEVSGAIGSSLGLLTSEIGDTVRVVVTATNQGGSTSATSEPTSAIKALLPANTKLPSITGLLQEGGLLEGATGSWTGSGPLEYSYAWELCNSAGASCKEVSGAIGTTLGLIGSEIGDTVRLVVTATNQGGSMSATSEATSVIKALLPSNTELPSVSGLLQEGGVLSALKGSWSGTGPFEYSYAWELCNGAGASCKEVPGAVGTTLGLLASEIGDTVRVVVTATNQGGSTSATSEPTSVIKALLPSNTKLPSITGLLQEGGLLEGAAGSWSGTAPLEYSYAWELCNSAGASCKEVSGAIGTTLGLIGSEIGDTVRLVVTATNQAGSTSATSEATSAIKALLPSNTEPPSISGVLQTGKLLSALVGKWSGSAPISYSYQWQTCGLLGQEKECVNIAKAIESTLKLEALEVGLTMRVLVTATNAAGPVSKASAITGLVAGLL